MMFFMAGFVLVNFLASNHELRTIGTQDQCAGSFPSLHRGGPRDNPKATEAIRNLYDYQRSPRDCRRYYSNINLRWCRWRVGSLSMWLSSKAEEPRKVPERSR